MSIERILEYKDHLTDQWYSREASPNHTDEEVEMIRYILKTHSKYGSPDFSKYQPITTMTCEIDEDGDFTDYEYETPLIEINGYDLKFEDVFTDLDCIYGDTLLDLLIVMQEFGKIEELSVIKERTLAHELYLENQRNKLCELIPQCKSIKLKKLLNNIYNKCLNSDSELYVEDLTEYKYDVEIEGDFGENIISYLEESVIDVELEIDGWQDAPLDSNYAKLIESWKWENVTLKNGNRVIIYRESEDWVDDVETYFISIFKPENMCNGQIN